jgi:hypothetical protein
MSQGETRGRRVADRRPTNAVTQPSVSVHTNGLTRQLILTSRYHLSFTKGGIRSSI